MSPAVSLPRGEVTLGGDDGAEDGAGSDGSMEGGVSLARSASSALHAVEAAGCAGRTREFAAAPLMCRDPSDSTAHSASAMATACSVRRRGHYRQRIRRNLECVPATDDQSRLRTTRKVPIRRRIPSSNANEFALQAAWCWTTVSLSLSERRTSMCSSRSPWARGRLNAARYSRRWEKASLSASS
eukprot:4107137-Pleurochrysis_carterae.AAC.1